MDQKKPRAGGLARGDDEGKSDLTDQKTGALPITVQNVTKTYGKVHALDDVSLEVKSGEFLTLLGPSGSGKTTVLRLIGGFTEASSGQILFDGQQFDGRHHAGP